MTSSSLQKLFVVTLLIFTGLFQGWPLLVAATCSMPEPQMMSRMGACCCCDKRENTATLSFSSCAPGKTLLGILSTDPSVLPGKDEVRKMDKSLPLAWAVEADVSLLAQSDGSPTFYFRVDQPLLFYISSPPIFLIDRVFRI